MNKKLIITEEQYKIIKSFILETKITDLVKNVIKPNDVLKITMGGKVFEFKVINITQGQILMDNIDKNSDLSGYRLSFSENDFENGVLSNVHATNKDELKSQNANTWPKINFKQVDTIDVYRGDKLIGTTKETDKKDVVKNDFIETLNQLKQNDGFKIKSNDLEMGLIVLENLNNLVRFEMSNDSKNKINNQNVKYIDISKDEIDVDEEGNVTITISQVDEVDDKPVNRTYNLEINEWGITDADDIEPEEEENSEEENKEEKPEEEENDFDKEEFIKMLTGDEQLRTAYYKNPSVWKSFFGELKGEKQRGTGYAAIQDILRTYTNNKIMDKFGDTFKQKGEISFEPMENIEVLYNEGDGNEYFTLNRGQVYKDESSVKRMGIDSNNESNEFEYDLRLANKKYNFEIIVKDITDETDIYKCDVKKLYYTDKTNENPKGVLKRSEPIKDVKIKFLDSTGYKPKKEEVKK